MKLLVIEDEYHLADLLATHLKKENYMVDIANDGEVGLYQALSGDYQLILLDIMLPHVDGFEILKELRENQVDCKVIMLSAKSELEDKLQGFTYGADDYITKPFHMEEVIARVNVQLRRSSQNTLIEYLEIGNLRLYIKKSRMYCTTSKEFIDISAKEFLLLEYMMQNKDLILSKEQLYQKVWGIDNDIESNNLEAYLSFIRKKLRIINANVVIKAIRGLGYRLEVSNEETKV